MSNITTLAAGELRLTEATIVGCDGMLESLKKEGSEMDLAVSLAPLYQPTEKFLPASKSIYVRKEMCQVFKELTKEDRKRKQILIGSPGVGKSILLFLVAIYQALTENKPCCFIRKVRDSEEPTSVFLFFKSKSAQAGTLTVYHSRVVSFRMGVESILQEMLVLLSKVPYTISEVLQSLMDNKVFFFLDGLHQGDEDLMCPHHYLSTSGGHDQPQGESAISTSLVVLGGWQKEALFKGLEIAAAGADVHSTDTTETETEDAGSPDDIFFHTGGRIREALQYSKNPGLWKAEKKDMIDKIPKEQAVLSLIETKGSSDPKSADRIRTMFRKEDGFYFGSAVQIVDSQYFARLLQDRVGLEDYFNAYKHAKERGLSSAAGCHFEELLHVLFQDRPKPIIQVLESVGKGAEGVQQLKDYFVYWIPNISNFANIDAAIVTKDEQGKATIWCLQYTVSSSHAFNSITFRAKFLRPVLTSFKLKAAQVKILFVVPDDVFPHFKPPEVQGGDLEGATAFVDCSDVEAVKDCFANFDFLDKPITLYDEVPAAKKAAALR